MNTTSKSDLLGIIAKGLSVCSNLPVSDLKTCVLIDGHALIQTLGKPQGCKTFGDYADVFMKIVRNHFTEHVTRVDVVFDRYTSKDSIKSATRLKRTGKKNPIRNL